MFFENLDDIHKLLNHWNTNQYGMKGQDKYLIHSNTMKFIMIDQSIQREK